MSKRTKQVLLFIFTLWVTILPVKALDSVYLGGDSIAIELSLHGVQITGSYQLENGSDPLKDTKLEKGDLIIEADGKAIQTITELFRAIAESPDELLELQVLRNNEPYTVTLPLYRSSDGKTKTGLYVKDRISGTGTMTFYHPKSQRYAALGHPITDPYFPDTDRIAEGSIYPGKIIGLKKSVIGTPGEKIGQAISQKESGSIDTNNEFGLFGQYYMHKEGATLINIASQEEVQKGPAVFYTVIEGTKVEAFDIEITGLTKQSSPSIKGISFVIKDERLMELTGGIVQGMSGSPIVQNGKLVGAVTHMLSGRPQSGYGIYIEWMYPQTFAID